MNEEFFYHKYAEERAKNAAHREMLSNLRFLTGYYGGAAERSGNAELAELVREMTEVLDGTWTEPEGPK
jgi:hypothetical protein